MVGLRRGSSLNPAEPRRTDILQSICGTHTMLDEEYLDKRFDRSRTKRAHLEEADPQDHAVERPHKLLEVSSYRLNRREFVRSTKSYEEI
jgi:hypothetical protein